MSSVKAKDSFLKGAFILGMAGILVKVMGAFFRIPLGNLIFNFSYSRISNCAC